MAEKGAPLLHHCTKRRRRSIASTSRASNKWSDLRHELLDLIFEKLVYNFVDVLRYNVFCLVWWTG
ncbi:hypothetical protein Pyn_37602 [Prunus yedoensis var. nudiflora]|uniref:Uncharacterized protein n=1 Tax=Prunus yedoensis var. nudiflora TaxID=2094558 RepID=A0A314XVC1_PRUYE|nr:hypothetical protein Pyn_37602 [Prunus yedoensis var. nudiflora]